MSEEFENFNNITNNEYETCTNTNKEREARIYTNIDWEGGKELLDKYSPLEDSVYLSRLEKMEYWAELASTMYKFNPERFNEEIEIKEAIWQELFKEANHRIEKGHSQLYPEVSIYEILDLPSSLKELDPKRFTENIKITDEDWDKIAEWLNIKNSNPLMFIGLYKKAHTIDSQKIIERLPIDGRDWEIIRKEIKNSPMHGWTYILDAQSIKPEEFSDITISQKEWEHLMDTLESWIANGRCDYLLWEYANALKKEEIKVEN